MRIIVEYNTSTVTEYFKNHHIPATFECLIAGLITSCPKDPLRWLLDGFQRIDEKGVSNISWDMLIPEELKSRVRNVADSYLNDILMFGASAQPNEEMLTIAYDFFWTNLKKKCFRGFVEYYQQSKVKKKKLELKIFDAKKHDNKRVLKVYFRNWINWSRRVKKVFQRTFDIIERAYMRSVCKLMLGMWLAAAHEEKKTREYFEKIEKGEAEDEFETEIQTGDFSDSISMLPNKCVMLIFSHLNIMELGRCAKVCKSWRVLAGSSTLWSNLNFYRIRYLVGDKLIQQFLQKYRAYILHLNLRQCIQVSSQTLSAIGECRNLQDLNLSENPNVNDHVMRIISENCLGLLYLNLSNTLIGNVTLRALARYSENLQYLNIAYCNKCTNRGLQYFSFARGCSKLVHLNLTGCIKFSAEGFLYIAQCCGNLQCLLIDEIGSVDDVTMGYLAKCINLRSLSMTGPTLTTDAGYKAVAVNQKLQKLCMESNRRVTDYSFKYISKCCLLLNHLYAVDCHQLSDVGVRHISHLRNLVVVNLADSVRISDAAVRYLVEGHSAARMRELNLSNCIKLTDISMLRISQKCRGLTHLSLCFCEHVTDSGIELLTHLPNLSDIDLSGTHVSDHGLEVLGELKSLRFLVISECSRITDVGLDKFSAHAKRLEGIDISHCMDLTDQGIKHLAFCCRRLTNVSLAGCPQVTDLSIQYLASVCKYLHVLNFSGCIRISDKGVLFLRRKCTQLRFLSLLYCRNISKKIAKIAAEKIENIEYNDDPVPSWFNYSDLMLLQEVNSEDSSG